MLSGGKSRVACLLVHFLGSAGSYRHWADRLRVFPPRERSALPLSGSEEKSMHSPSAEAYRHLRELISQLERGKIYDRGCPIPSDAWFDQPETVQARWDNARLRFVASLDESLGILESQRQVTSQTFQVADKAGTLWEVARDVAHYTEHGLAAKQAIAAAGELAVWLRNAIELLNGWGIADRFDSDKRLLAWERHQQEYPASCSVDEIAKLMRRANKEEMVLEANRTEQSRLNATVTSIPEGHPFGLRRNWPREVAAKAQRFQKERHRYLRAYYASEYVRFCHGNNLTIEQTWKFLDKMVRQGKAIDTTEESSFVEYMKAEGHDEIDDIDGYKLNLGLSTFKSYVSHAKKILSEGRNSRALTSETRSILRRENH